MGFIRMGVPRTLIQELQKKLSINHFIEAGTYYGGTAVWAASVFAHVTTIEASSEIYAQTSTRYRELTNVKFLQGDSRTVLKELIPTLTEPAIFWLDSHWSGENTYGTQDECPLLEELALITSSPLPHAILIDDARLFTSPPPLPHNADQWPKINEVMSALTVHHDKPFIVIIDDVIVAVPSIAREVVEAYCRGVNAEIMAEHLKQIRKLHRFDGLKRIIYKLRKIVK